MNIVTEKETVETKAAEFIPGNVYRYGCTPYCLYYIAARLTNKESGAVETFLISLSDGNRWNDDSIEVSPQAYRSRFIDVTNKVDLTVKVE